MQNCNLYLSMASLQPAQSIFQWATYLYAHCEGDPKLSAIKVRTVLSNIRDYFFLEPINSNKF